MTANIKTFRFSTLPEWNASIVSSRVNGIISIKIQCGQIRNTSYKYEGEIYITNIRHKYARRELLRTHHRSQVDTSGGASRG